MLDTRVAAPPAPSRTTAPAAPPDVAPVEPLHVGGAPAEVAVAPQFGAALVCGAAAALVGATAWSAVTFVTRFQIGWMAVGVGAGVGIAVRRGGRGVEQRFAFAAAALALLGCLAGNLLATVAYIASSTHVPFFHVLGCLDVAAARDLMKATYSPIDLLFYGVAMFEAFKFAVPRVTSP